MIHNLSLHNSILAQFIAELRDLELQVDRPRFRKNMERAGEIFAYEISKTLEYKPREVETPYGTAKVNVPIDNIVIGSILRAGLPMHQGLLNYFDSAESSFISAYRAHHKDGSFEIEIPYMTSSFLGGKVLILTDPMLATGSSMEKAINESLERGEPKSIHIATIIASSYGLSYLERLFPKVHIWMGAIDEELTAKSYIVPGLGDAGDLCFGSKEAI